MAVTRRALHVEDTRRALLAAARHEFAARGYAQASLDDIAARARLTKGALYHHFKSKAALLTAVYLEMEEELAVQVSDAVAACAGDARARLFAAVGAFFAASAEPAYARIVLRDAPGVLDRVEGRSIDHAIGLGLVTALVTGLRDEGRLGPQLPLTMAARMLLAAVSEIAMSMAHADDPAAVQRDGMLVIDALVTGLALATARPADVALDAVA
ncbi:MAG: TetR/AcrR family transcriptional regulator [Myxococcales bacterium]|nr:TetR/AcrR family transcriptional regulator [Myxococcales bacterium]